MKEKLDQKAVKIEIGQQNPIVSNVHPSGKWKKTFFESSGIINGDRNQYTINEKELLMSIKVENEVEVEEREKKIWQMPKKPMPVLCEFGWRFAVWYVSILKGCQDTYHTYVYMCTYGTYSGEQEK